MPKAYNFLILLIFCIFCLGLGFSATCTTNHKVLYTDSTDFSVDVVCNNSPIDWELIIGCNNITSGLGYQDKIINNSTISFTCNYLAPYPSNLNLKVDVKDLFSENILDYSITPKSGMPSFILLVSGENTGEGTVFDNKETVTVKIKGNFDGTNYFDNNDDGSETLDCTVYLGNDPIPAMSQTIKYIDTEINLGELALDVGVEKALKVKCGNKEVQTSVKREDKSPTINVKLSPTTIKPNSNVDCIPSIIDVDTDASEYDTPIYSWTKNAVDMKVGASRFDCSKYGCKAGDTLVCSVKYFLGEKEFLGSEKDNVSSLLSNVEISAPIKAQIGEELSLQSNFNYTGTDKLVFSWSFGDGKTSTTQNPKKTYEKKGKYSITLTITDNKGSTETVSHTIEIVDADISINVKNPLVNQEFNKGEKIKVLANITDNTGTSIPDANVTAELISNDKNFPKIILTKVLGTINSYEGELELDYLANELSEIKFTAEYSKGKLKLKAIKSVPIVLISTDLINPEIELVTKFPEEENVLSVGNTIESLYLCFRLPNNKLDDAFSNAKLILEASETIEYKLEEVENKCYIVNVNYRVKSLDYDTKIIFKLKDAKDDFGNYVKLSKKIEYDVIEGQDVLDIVLVEPKINKTNYGQKIFVSAKYVLKNEFEESKLKELKSWVEYKSKVYELENFQGYFMPENEPKINFKLVVSGLYDERLFEKEISKSLDVTNELKVELISPSESGVIKSSGKIILAIKYQNDTLYDANSITMYYDDQNLIFSRIDSGNYKGYFSTDYDNIGILKSTILNFKGSDTSGNNFLLNKEIPTMSLFMPLFGYYILLGIVIVLIILTISISSLSSKQKAFAKELQGKSYEQLQDDLEVEKRILGDLKRKYFKQEINETEFKMKKTEVESKISVLESKLSVENQKENKHLEQGKEYLDSNINQKQILEKRLGLENNVYSQYKQDIDILTYKLKPFKDKYTAEEMRIAIKQSKNLPENVIDKIIEKIYN